MRPPRPIARFWSIYDNMAGMIFGSIPAFRRANVGVERRGDARVPNEQRLTVGIEVVRDDARGGMSPAGRLEHFGKPIRKLSAKVAMDVAPARPLDGVETGTALLAAQRLELLQRCRLAEVSAKDRDVDVLREPVDEAERF
jgi:hypothetical protein